MPPANPDCFISLGSNLGDRLRHLRFALARLDGLPETRLVRSSSVYRTNPVGKRNQPEFLNAVVRLRTRLSPMGMLVELKRLEALRGRRPGSRWSPRPLDCDLLFHGQQRLRTRLIELPHPYALKRRFVLVPFAEIAALWRPPARPRMTVQDWLDRLTPDFDKVQWNRPNGGW